MSQTTHTGTSDRPQAIPPIPYFFERSGIANKVDVKVFIIGFYS